MRFSSPLLIFALAAPSYASLIRTTNAKPAVSAQNATVEALTYGLPLLPYVGFANSIAKSLGAWNTNSFFHATSLLNSSYKVVVLPNVDTLYSEAVLDLSVNDVVATIPPVPAGRFYVWPFYDVYGNNFCDLGRINNSTAGQYLVKYRASNPGCVGASGKYAGTIYMPTIYGATLLRIEVSNSSDVDVVVSSVQPGFTLSTAPSTAALRAPVLTQALLNDNLNTTDVPMHIMQLTARLAAFNRPEVAADVVSVACMLEAAGIDLRTNTYTQPAGVDLTAAYATAHAAILRIPDSPDFIDLGSGWSTLDPAISGDFKSQYADRALIALTVYLQVQASQAVYPTYEASTPMFSNETYLVEFFGKPQVAGFWSLTMYDGDGYLVPNDLNRYSLNNRGNLTYTDGSLVYGGNSSLDSTESFYMLLQTTDIAVSSEWEFNWLPTPANGTEFRPYLRWYGPSESLTDGMYKYPKITVVEANPPLPSN
ncbi:hypothetical protein C8R46DRAFT_1273041 [Mycena filopes]|nr:hypothetical protein C8R46DRAFT_1273041 [Mycena filopes]